MIRYAARIVMQSWLISMALVTTSFAESLDKTIEMPEILQPVSSADFPIVTLGMVMGERGQLTERAHYLEAAEKEPELIQQAFWMDDVYARRRRLGSNGNVTADEIRKADMDRRMAWANYHLNRLKMKRHIYQANDYTLLLYAEGSRVDVRLPFAENSLERVRILIEKSQVSQNLYESMTEMADIRLRNAERLYESNYISGEEVEALRMEKQRYQGIVNAKEQAAASLLENLYLMEKTVDRLRQERDLPIDKNLGPTKLKSHNILPFHSTPP